MIDRKSGPTVRHWFEETFASRHFRPTIAREVADVESLLLSVEAGLGVTFHTSRTVAFFPNFDLVCLELLEEGMEVETVLAWNTPISNPSVERFVQEFEGSMLGR